jgi:hypothetical protein
VIIKMSKVEVIGPRDQLIAALDAIRATHTMEIDPEIQSRMAGGAEARLQPLTLDARSAAERVVYEDLAGRIDRLLDLVPEVPGAVAHIHGAAAFESIAHLVDTHLATCRSRIDRRETLCTELVSGRHTLSLLTVVEALAPKGGAAAEPTSWSSRLPIPPRSSGCRSTPRSFSAAPK